MIEEIKEIVRLKIAETLIFGLDTIADSDLRKCNFRVQTDKLLSQSSPKFWADLFGSEYERTGDISWGSISQAISSITLGMGPAFRHPDYRVAFNPTKQL